MSEPQDVTFKTKTRFLLECSWNTSKQVFMSPNFILANKCKIYSSWIFFNLKVLGLEYKTSKVDWCLFKSPKTQPDIWRLISMGCSMCFKDSRLCKVIEAHSQVFSSKWFLLNDLIRAIEYKLFKWQKNYSITFHFLFGISYPNLVKSRQPITNIIPF